jgi:hypothetical protein
MSQERSIEAVKEAGGHLAAPEDLLRLYRLAFDRYGARALWSSRAVERPTVAHVLAISEPLRVEGDLAARRLAEEIEQACRAAV